MDDNPLREANRRANAEHAKLLATRKLNDPVKAAAEANATILRSLQRREGDRMQFWKMMKDVREFHVKVEDPDPPADGLVVLLDAETCYLRGGLAHEEVVEHTKANMAGDRAKVLDALLDQLFVLIGTIVKHGFSPGQIAMGWVRVHRANMLKQPDPIGRKARKPANWKAPDLSDLLPPEQR